MPCNVPQGRQALRQRPVLDDSNRIVQHVEQRRRIETCEEVEKCVRSVLNRIADHAHAEALNGGLMTIWIVENHVRRRAIVDHQHRDRVPKHRRFVLQP